MAGYAGTDYTGTWFVHDVVNGEGLVPLIVDAMSKNMVLGEMDYMDGFVLA